AGHLDDVAGARADGDGAVGGDVDVHRVAEPGGAAGAGQGHAAGLRAGGVEARDDVVPAGDEEVAGGVGGHGAVVGAGGQRDRAHERQRGGVVDADGLAGQGVDLAVEADVDVNGFEALAEARGGAGAQVEADDAVGPGRVAGDGHVAGEGVVLVEGEAAVADVAGRVPAGVGLLAPGARGGGVRRQGRLEGAVVDVDLAGGGLDARSAGGG